MRRSVDTITEWAVNSAIKWSVERRFKAMRECGEEQMSVYQKLWDNLYGLPESEVTEKAVSLNVLEEVDDGTNMSAFNGNHVLIRRTVSEA